jgi:hypothetical protein
MKMKLTGEGVMTSAVRSAGEEGAMNDEYLEYIMGEL